MYVLFLFPVTVLGTCAVTSADSTRRGADGEVLYWRRNVWIWVVSAESSSKNKEVLRVEGVLKGKQSRC